jgi:hypothetical protein
MLRRFFFGSSSIFGVDEQVHGRRFRQLPIRGCNFRSMDNTCKASEEATIPRLEDRLPDLLGFARTLAGQIEVGEIRDGDALAARIRVFYTAEQTAAIEAVAPGWTAMAAYADGTTLHHVTQVLIALQLLPEYRQASSYLQALMEWSVLFHDLAKQVIAGQRDALHAFRSATMAARSLPRAGFATSRTYLATLEPWSRLVLDASVATPDGKGTMQDNRVLPEILRGVDQLFGAGSAAGLIVQAAMLHQSLNVVPEWPNPGSLTEAQVPACIRPDLVPLLEGLMLADSDAWQLFEPDRKAKFRASTLAVFDTVRKVVAG